VKHPMYRNHPLRQYPPAEQPHQRTHASSLDGRVSMLAHRPHSRDPVRIQFVSMSSRQEEAVWATLGNCVNPYFWPLVACAMDQSMRRSSLFGLRWDTTDLEVRIARVRFYKTWLVDVPLSEHVVSVLRGMPRHSSGKVFPATCDATRMVWDGVPIDGRLPSFHFRDIRRLGRTAYAKRGLSSLELRTMLEQKQRTATCKEAIEPAMQPFK
jgi:integrase